MGTTTSPIKYGPEPDMLARVLALEVTLHLMMNLLTAGDAKVLDEEHRRLALQCKQALQNAGALRPDKAVAMREFAEHVDKALDLIFAHAKTAR